MKKICRKILVVTMILSMILPTVVLAADQKAQAYLAYHDYVAGKIEDGYLLPSRLFGNYDYDYRNQGGIVYAKLLDFDGDGMNELFTIESVYSTYNKSKYEAPYDINYYVYDYQNGAMKLIASEYYFSFHEGFCTDSNGKSYYYENIDSPPFSEYFDYYSITNGKWTKQRLEKQWIYEYWGDFRTSFVEDIYYRIGETKVSKSAFTAKENFLKGKKFEHITQTLPDWTPHNVKAELAKYIPAGYSATFSTPSAWAQAGVNNAISMGVVPSHLQGKYSRPITRQEFCALAVQYYETTTGNTITQRAYFTDTDDINVQKMGGMGIVGGVGGGRFDPNGTLTREAAASILVRLSEALGSPMEAAEPAFADNSKISSWAFDKVGQIQAAGIMGGTGNNQFSPKASYTREQSIITVTKLSAFQPSVEGVELKEDEVELFIKASTTLTPEFEGTATANKMLTWTSSDTGVAIVDKNGRVTATGGGKATITATAPGGASGTCTVKVIEPEGQLYVELPVKIRYYYTDGWTDKVSYEGAVKLTSVEEYSENTYRVDGVITDMDEYDFFFDEEIGWRILDHDGNIVDSGISSVGNFEEEEGEEFWYLISSWKMKDTEKYILEFYEVK